MARKDGYIMEHRLIVARALGRYLKQSEVVHHRNHDPQDNSMSNLELFASNQDHKLYEAHGTPEPIWRGSSHSTIVGRSGVSVFRQVHLWHDATAKYSSPATVASQNLWM